MPHTRWFEGAMLNYAEEVFRRADDRFPAIIFQAEHIARQEISWAELRTQVAALRAHLLYMGVKPGDRVVGYLPNIPQATVALLASLSIGAVWSCCSPDFGASSVLERVDRGECLLLWWEKI
jgi:acetoacetyl-CoA synthetase